MSQDSTLGVYILTGLLITVLVTAIPIVAAERTVFDSTHALETMEDEGVYTETTVAFQDRVTELVADATGDDVDLLDEQQRQRIATEAVTESYVESQLSGHIDRAYGYLNGDRDDVRFVFDLSEPKAAAIAEATVVEREARAAQDPQIDSPDAVPSDQLVIGPYLLDELEDTQNITRGGAVPGELETARTASAVVGILWWLLPVLAVALVAFIHFLATSLRRTGEAVGSAFVAAGLLGLVVGLAGRPIARSLAEGRLQLENPAFSSLSDGLVAIVGGLFDLVLLQSGILFLVGVVALGVISAEANGFFESLTNGDEPARGDAGDDGTDQYSRGADEMEHHSTETESETNLFSESQVADEESQADTAEQTKAGPSEYDPDEYDEHGFKIDESDSQDREQ